MSPRAVDRGWVLGRRRVIIVTTIAVIAVIAGFLVWRAAPAPRTPAEREAIAKELVSGIRVSTTLSDSTLAASKALVDFLPTNDVRLVLVRIVADLDVEIRIATGQTIAFAEPPSFCLIGPDSAPDDAGYSSPCWGAPDLGELIAAQLPVDAAGHVTFPAEGTTVRATLQRGGQRCDYSPGSWLLVVKGDPLVDGTPAGAREFADVDFEVPWLVAGPLPFLEVRTVAYCGLANRIYTEQGEPEIVSPAP